MKLFPPTAVLPIANDEINGGPEMLKSNAINLLGIFAALALSSLFLTRAATLPRGGTQPENVIAASAPAKPIIIKSYPADAVIIEALPGN